MSLSSLSWLRRFKRLPGRTQRYLIIGVSVYVFELLVIVAAQALGAGSVAAVAWAFWLGLGLSFILQKFVTFGDKRLHHKIVAAQVAAYGLLVLFNFGFTLLLTDLLDSVLPAVACRTLALVITTAWNFYLYKTHIFVQKKPKKGAAKRKRAHPVTVKVVKLQKKWRKQKRQALRSYRAWRRRPRIKKLRKLAARPGFGRKYLIISLGVLLLTTLFWSLLGARLQQSNADQLVNAHLFNDWPAFRGAVFPEQHTFFIKWPLFIFIRLCGYAPWSFMVVTAAAAVASVSGLVYVLSRLERRPLVLGSLCLLLASTLLLVPPQAYAGALLPVNLAMLSTRNLEYVFYIAALAYLVKARRVRSRPSYAALVLMILLVASDKLFLSISAVGAAVALLCYGLRRKRELSLLAARWLFLSLAAGAVAAVFLAFINHVSLTHIAGAQSGPYGLVNSAKDAALGIIFGIGGILTNFGANPAYDALTLRAIPGSLLHHLWSPAGPAYLINLVTFGLCLAAGTTCLMGTFKRSKAEPTDPSAAVWLPVLLLWSGLAAFAVFAGSQHYYPVDARYLTIWLFALFVAAAAWLRPRRFDAELALVALPIIAVAIICGLFGSLRTYNQQQQALNQLNLRSKTAAQILASHRVPLLVGDYWRVLPIQAADKQHNQNVLPLDGCTTPKPVLTSRQWQPDLRRTGFAYLLTLDGSQTGYPGCKLSRITAAYGEPNSSALVAGTLEHPRELLLFYDQGAHAAATSHRQATETVLPVALSDLMHTGCPGPTVMNVVAHQDDDLLFMNPDLLHDIAAGHCVRTVYLTAGDAGRDRQYWLAREQGSEAAYAEMAHYKGVWVQRTVRLPGGQFVTVASPRGNDRISLIFMDLPDGNLHGEGFAATRHESLDGLAAKRLSRLQTVDGQSSYTADTLTGALNDLMRAYQPSEVHTQSSYSGLLYKDHSDHLNTGQFAAKAFHRYQNQPGVGQTGASLVFYLGYPVREFPSDVEDEDLQAKEVAFAAYGAHDGDVCLSLDACQQNPVYGLYLTREYPNPY